MTYRYPQVNGGYRWNMLQRIEQEVGIAPSGTSDIQVDETWHTCIMFNRQLTESEKISLDALIENSPTFPPSSPTRFLVKDVWNQREAIAEAIGIPYRIFYSQSIPGGEVDQVELHFDRVLTDQEKVKVREEYASLIQEVGSG